MPREAVGNWLYGVAHQTAVRLRAIAAKKGSRERQVLDMPESVVKEASSNDLLLLLDQELSCLPEKHRLVIVLCDLEGKTRKELARQLGISEGAVAGRLARARAMLAKRLASRGLAFSGGALGAALSQGAASASAPATLVASTIKAVSLMAAGQAVSAGLCSAKVIALTEGVVKTMFVSKIKSVLAVVLVVGVVFGGVGVGHGLFSNGQAVAQQGANPVGAKKPPVKEEKNVPQDIAAKEAGEKPAGKQLEEKLKAKDFWAKTGNKKDHPDIVNLFGPASPPADVAGVLKSVAGNSEITVRIRAFKLIADMLGRSHFAPTLKPGDAEDAVEGAFTYLEANLKDATVQKFRPQLGFTHVSMVKDDKGIVWVLIEYTTNDVVALNSEINLRWNPKTKKVDQVKHWGSDRGL